MNLLKVGFFLFLALWCLSEANSQNDTIFIKKKYLTDSIILLDEAVVEAYQINSRLKSIPGSLSVITAEKINYLDNTNFASILNTIPGVIMQSGTYNTSRIVIRGMGSRTPYNTNRIRSYLNDIPLTTSDGISTPEEIDLLNIERIEIIKGPASALYGSGLGGNINLYTPDKTKNEGIISAQYGSYNTKKINLSGTLHSKNTDFWSSISHLQSNGYRENNSYKRTLFLSTAKWEHHKWSVSPLLLLMVVDAGIPSSLGKTMYENQPQYAAPNWNAIGGCEKYFKGTAGITIKNKPSNQTGNQFTIFGRWNDSYEKRPFNNLDDLSVSGGIRNKLSFHFTKTDWIIGAEWILEQYNWEINKNGTLLSDNHENRYQLNFFGMLYYRPVSRINISIAGAINSIRYSLTDNFAANGDQSGNHNFPTIFSPRFGINYALNDKWTIYGSTGYGFSLPSPEETLLPEGNINTGIKPEQGIQYEIGTRLSANNKTIELDGAFYWIELKNLLVTKRFSEEIFMGINAGKTRHQGIELMIKNHFFNFENFPGILYSNLSYSKSFNRFIEFTNDSIKYDSKKLPGIPKQTMQLQIIWSPFKIFKISTNIQYIGMQYLNDLNSEYYPHYWLGNIQINCRVLQYKTRELNIYAGLNNITNNYYASMLVVNAIGAGASEPRYYYPGLPRNFYLRVSFSL